MRAVALANQKGGVGKTTSAATLGACLAMKGRRVLLIDIDPQANLSIHLNIDIHGDLPSVYSLLIGRAEVGDVIQKTAIENLDIVPADINLAGAEIELVGIVGRETVLKEALAPVMDSYDYILIDCPPSLGLLTLNAFTTVTELFIPLQTEFFALHGMSKLLETVEIVRKRLNPDLRITGIIATLHDHRTNLASEVLQNIRDYFGPVVFKTVIRKNVRLAESPSYGQVIVEYDETAHGAQDYMALTDEVIAREPDGAPPPEEAAPEPEAAEEPAAPPSCGLGSVEPPSADQDEAEEDASDEETEADVSMGDSAEPETPVEAWPPPSEPIAPETDEEEEKTDGMPTPLSDVDRVSSGEDHG